MAGLLVALLDPFAVGTAIVGLMIGYALGAKLRHHEPSLPLWGAASGAVVFYLFAWVVVIVAAAAAACVLIFVGFRFRQNLRDGMLLFAQTAGRKCPRRDFLDHRALRRARLNHDKRIVSILNEDVDDEIRGELLELERERYRSEITGDN